MRRNRRLQRKAGQRKEITKDKYHTYHAIFHMAILLVKIDFYLPPTQIQMCLSAYRDPGLQCVQEYAAFQ